MTTLLIRQADVLDVAADGTSVGVLAAHDLWIERERIVAVVPSGTHDRSRADTVLDATGLMAMPGMINTHAHTPMILWRGLAEDVPIAVWFNERVWVYERNLTPDDVYWGTLLAQDELLTAGVTTVAEHYFHPAQAVRALEQTGGRALLGPAVFGSLGRAALNDTAAFVADLNGGASTRLRAWMAPHAPYTCDDDFLRAAARHAERLGVGVHIHAAETRAETEASLRTRGQTPIQVLDAVGVLGAGALIAHACGATPADIALLAARGTAVAHCPKTYLKLAMGVAPITDMLAAGVTVGLGTDGPMSNNTLDLWEPLRLAAMLQKHDRADATALPVAQALWLATRGGARAIGMGGVLGALEPGFLADVVLVDMSGPHHTPLHDVPTSLVYHARPSDVRHVLVDGRVVVRDGRALGIDRATVRAHVQAALPRLLALADGAPMQTYSVPGPA